MDERVPRGPSLDLPQSHQVPALEAAVAVFEFPQWRVRRPGVENIAHCATFQHGLRVDVYRLAECLPLWKPYMFNWRTNEEMLVCLKYDLQTRLDILKEVKAPDARTTGLWKTRLKVT